MNINKMKLLSSTSTAAAAAALFLALASAALDLEASAFCSLVEFKQACNSTMCTGESVEAIDKNACGLAVDDSGHIIMASASNAAKEGDDDGVRPDLSNISQLVYLKSLYLYSSGVSRLPKGIGSLAHLESL